MVTTTTTTNTNKTPTTNPKVSITSTTHDTTGGANSNSSHIYSYHSSSDASNNPYETPPTIHQYHETTSTTTSSVFHGLRSISSGSSGIGDTSLLPNIGRTNRYAEYALFGLAYHELMMRLQLSISITAVLVLVVLFLTWYMQLFQPIHLVLSVLVAILSFILVMIEGKTLLNNIFSTSGTTTTSFATTTPAIPTTTSSPTTIHVVMKHLERIGTIILYHPIGKTVYLLTCSLLCFYITGIAMFLFSVLFLLNALTLIYCYVTYPECRKSFESLQDQQSSIDGTNDVNSNSNNDVARSWSSYYSDIANAATASSWVSERASLLRS